MLDIEKLLADYIKHLYALDRVKILGWHSELDAGYTTYWVRYTAGNDIINGTIPIPIINLITFVYESRKHAGAAEICDPAAAG